MEIQKQIKLLKRDILFYRCIRYFAYIWGIVCLFLGLYAFITLEPSTTFTCIAKLVANAIIIIFSISLIYNAYSIKECEKILSQELMEMQNVR